jgi:hypothetical protein
VRSYRLNNDYIVQMNATHQRFCHRNRERRNETVRLQNEDEERKASKSDYYRQYRLENNESVRDSMKRRYMLDRRECLGAAHHYNPRIVANRSWKTPELVSENFESIAKQLHVASPYDWYRISTSQIIDLGGKSLLDGFVLFVCLSVILVFWVSPS